MIVCPVCTAQNEEFAVRCSSCGSYVQDRVPTLDLFATVWLIIESPRTAFRRIIIAEHKNYVVLLGLFVGISAVFALFRAHRFGDEFDNLFPLLLFGAFFGGLAAVPLVFLWTGLNHLLAKTVGGKGAFRDSYGVSGWALVPVMFTAVFVLPLELATLGLHLFSTNPTAYQLKPEVTLVLLGLDAAAVVWTLILNAVGLSAAHRFPRIAGAGVSLTAALLTAAASTMIFTFFTT